MTTPRFFIIVVLPLIGALSFGAKNACAQNCFKFDVDCCRCCSQHTLTCSECPPPSGFSCCPIITHNGIVPFRVYPVAYGWSVGTWMPSGLSTCAIEYQSANCNTLQCSPTAVYDSFYCVVDDLLDEDFPGENCPSP